MTLFADMFTASFVGAELDRIVENGDERHRKWAERMAPHLLGMEPDIAWLTLRNFEKFVKAFDTWKVCDDPRLRDWAIANEERLFEDVVSAGFEMRKRQHLVVDIDIMKDSGDPRLITWISANEERLLSMDAKASHDETSAVFGIRNNIDRMKKSDDSQLRDWAVANEARLFGSPNVLEAVREIRDFAKAVSTDASGIDR